MTPSISIAHLRNVTLAALLLITLFTLAICGVARGETEPDWDTFIPIVIQIESSGNPNAISQDDCRGLMQVSPIVMKEYQDLSYKDGLTPVIRSKEELFCPWLNVVIGTWYLHRIWEHYLPHYHLDQTIENLLIAYNFGIGNLVKYRQGKIKLPKETRDYLVKYKRLAKSK